MFACTTTTTQNCILHLHLHLHHAGAAAIINHQGVDAECPHTLLHWGDSSEIPSPKHADLLSPPPPPTFLVLHLPHHGYCYGEHVQRQSRDLFPLQQPHIRPPAQSYDEKTPHVKSERRGSPNCQTADPLQATRRLDMAPNIIISSSRHSKLPRRHRRMARA